MSNCEIKTLPSGGVKVETYPQLFREIQNYTDSQNKALSMYGMTLTDEFKDLNLKNPTLEDLLVFIDNFNSFESKNLTKKERQLFMDMTLTNEKVENIREQFVESFTVNGIFGININQIESIGLFDANTALEILNMADTVSIQKLYYKLKNSNEDFSNVVTPFNISDGTQFGKLNPDKVLTDIYNNYIGLTTADQIADKANEIMDEVVLNNTTLIPQILQMVSNKKLLVSYETDGDFSEVVPKVTNSTRLTIENTLDPAQNFSPILDQLEVLLSLDLEQVAYDYEDVRKYISNVEQQASRLGIDMNNLSEVIADRNYNEVQDYLNSLYNFISDINSNNVELLAESFDTYILENDRFFRVTPEFKNGVTDTVENEGVFLNLETNRSEQELFQDKSIIKIEGNTYQKITDNKSQSELNEMIYQNPTLLPKEVYSVAIKEANKSEIIKDIDDYVNEKSRSLLNPNSDIDIIKKITSYKILLGVEMEIEKTYPDTSYLITDMVNPSDFMISFNKKILKNPKLKDIFYFSNRGLEAKQEIGDYTLNQLKDELSETTFNKLQQFALISNNRSLTNLKPQYELLDTDDINILRDFYSNNLSQLEELLSPYQIIGNGAVIENITEPFVKIRGELYEQINPNVYERLQIDTRYKNYGLKKPASTIENVDRYLSPNRKEEKTKVKTINIENSEIEFC